MFTSSIKIEFSDKTNLSQISLSSKIKIKNTISANYSSYYASFGRSLGEYNLFSLSLSVPKSSSVIATVDFDGSADDYIIVYLNNNRIGDTWGANIPKKTCSGSQDSYCYYPCYNFSSDITNVYQIGVNSFIFNLYADGLMRGVKLNGVTVYVTYITY